MVGVWVLDPDRSAVRARRCVLEVSGGDAPGVVLRWTDPAGERRVVGGELGADGALLERPPGGSPWDGVHLRLVGEALHAERDGAGFAVFWRARDDVKQVIVYRRDLNMRKGKIAAQVAHASLAVLLDRDEGPAGALHIPLTPAMASWTRSRFKKIVLSVETEADLLRVHAEARARGLPTALVTDAGHTEFGGVPTRTTCAVGPAESDAIDVITGPQGVVATKLP